MGPEPGYSRYVTRVAVVLLALVALGVAGVALAAGNPAAGKKVYTANGCGACHTFKPAGTVSTVGPALTKARLTADAKRAKQPLTTFIRTSITKPNAYVAKGFSKGVMPLFPKLTKKQLDDLVAFIAKG